MVLVVSADRGLVKVAAVLAFVWQLCGSLVALQLMGNTLHTLAPLHAHQHPGHAHRIKKKGYK